MPGKTNIEWTDRSWNPTTGCTQISPGCAHCYAKTLTERFNGKGSFDTLVLHPDRLEAPLHWRKPSRVFVNSMSDLFHEDVGPAFVDEVFRIMWLTPQHTYQVLTKRPERMREYLTTFPSLPGKASAKPRDEEFREAVWGSDSPLPNVWLGVTVENQHWADVRIPILLDTPAAVRFVSAEPLLEAVNFCALPHPSGDNLNALYGCTWVDGSMPDMTGPSERIDWVIIGGESGAKHRPFDPQWARSIVAQCAGAGVSAFVKQLGGAHPGNKLEDLPEDLRVREYPA